jgi:hypothetical protein
MRATNNSTYAKWDYPYLKLVVGRILSSSENNSLYVFEYEHTREVCVMVGDLKEI